MLPNLIKSHAMLLPVLLIVLQRGAISCTDKQRADKGGSIEDSSTTSTENATAVNTPNGNVNFVTASGLILLMQLYLSRLLCHSFQSVHSSWSQI